MHNIMTGNISGNISRLTPPYHFRRHAKQQGAALLLAIIVLATLTAFAFVSSSMLNSSERNSRSAVYFQVALNSAEAALKDGVDSIDNSRDPVACGKLSENAAVCAADQFYQLDAASNTIDLAQESTSYWSNRAAEIQSVSNTQLAAISGSSSNIPQRFVTGHSIPGSGALDIGRGARAPKKMLFEITSIGRDNKGVSEVVVRQSVVRNVNN